MPVQEIQVLSVTHVLVQFFVILCVGPALCEVLLRSEIKPE